MKHILTAALILIATAASVSADEPKAATSVSERNPRVLFITSKDCARCETELSRLRRAGGDFEKMQGQGWKIGAGADSHLQIVDREAIAELVEKLGVPV